MNIKALLFTIAGGVVILFYALESFLSFQANGFTAPLLVKLLICALGVNVFVRNVKRIKRAPQVVRRPMQPNHSIKADGSAAA